MQSSEGGRTLPAVRHKLLTTTKAKGSLSPLSAPSALSSASPSAITTLTIDLSASYRAIAELAPVRVSPSKSKLKANLPPPPIAATVSSTARVAATTATFAETVAAVRAAKSPEPVAVAPSNSTNSLTSQQIPSHTYRALAGNSNIQTVSVSVPNALSFENPVDLTFSYSQRNPYSYKVTDNNRISIATQGKALIPFPPAKAEFKARVGYTGGSCRYELPQRSKKASPPRSQTPSVTPGLPRPVQAAYSVRAHNGTQRAIERLPRGVSRNNGGGFYTST